MTSTKPRTTKFIPEDNDELIYVNKNEKRERGDDDDDEELLVPVLLDSMFLFDNASSSSSPTAVVDELSNTNNDPYYDDSQDDESTYSALPDHLMIPTLGGDEDTTTKSISFEDRLDDALRQQPSSFSTYTATTESVESNVRPFSFPEDIRYEGEVTFQTSPFERKVTLRPRPLDNATRESIFSPRVVRRRSQTLDFVYNGDASSHSSSENCYDGSEEFKEEEEEVEQHDQDHSNNKEDGFLFTYGEYLSEDEYWHDLNGHCAKQGIGKAGMARRHSSIFSPHQKSESKNLETLVESFMNMFACGEYGKPYSSKPLVSVPSTNSFVNADDPCTRC